MTTDERLEKLERELVLSKRNNRWLLAVLGLIVLTLILARIFSGGENTAQAQEQGRVVRANQFILEDAMGRTRGKLWMDKEGPGLALYDEKGDLRATLGTLGTGPVLGMHDESGNLRVLFGVDKDAPGLIFFDKLGKTRVWLGEDEEGPSLALFDGKIGKARARLSTLISYGPTLVLFDDKGKRLWSAP